MKIFLKIWSSIYWKEDDIKIYGVKKINVNKEYKIIIISVDQMIFIIIFDCFRIKISQIIFIRPKQKESIKIENIINYI